jgi:putative endonuclease
MNTAWVYILECADGTYYTGSTTQLESRFAKHQTGYYGGYTSLRLPVTLVWSQEFPDIRQAIEAERKIKRWSHGKKSALIKADFELLHHLAQSKEKKQRLHHAKGCGSDWHICR